TRGASLQVAVAVQSEQRPPPDQDPELPGDVCRRFTARTDDAAVYPPQVMPGTDGDPVVPRVVAAARAEDDVVVVKLLPRRARRDGAPPAIRREDRVAMARL